MGEGTEDVKLKFASGSLGEALEAGGGPLAGTTASAGGLKAELVRSEIQPLWDDLDGEQVLRRMRVKLFLKVEAPGQPVKELESFVEFQLELFYDAFQMDLPDDARAIAEATLAKLLALGDLGALQDLLRPLLDDLMPRPQPGSLLEWLEKEGARALQAPHSYLVRVEADGATLTASLKSIEVERSFRTFGSVKLTVQLAANNADGSLLEQAEQELYSGGVTTEAASTPPPDLSAPHFQKLLSDWKAYLSQSLASAYEEGGPSALIPGEIFPDTSLPALLEEWALHGPPGPIPQRVRVSEAVLERTSASLRPCSAEEMAKLQEFLGPELSAAYFVEGYQLGICQGDSGDDWIVLREKTSEPILLMRADDDPSSRLRYTIDGDGWTARAVLGWLSEVLQESGHDTYLPRVGGPVEQVLDDDNTLSEKEPPEVEEDDEGEGETVRLEPSQGASLPEVTEPADDDANGGELDEDEDEDDEGDEGGAEEALIDTSDQIALSDWLKFRGPYREDEPMFDWRHPNDLIVDGAPYWDSSDLYMAPPPLEEVARIKSREVPAYYRFIRRVLDPEFVGALEPKN